MFDLLVYDSRRTEKLLLTLGVRLSGKPVESAMLPTGELLVLMREGSLYSLHLHGASPYLPLVQLEEKMRDHHAMLLIPLTARKLMAGKGTMKIKHVTRAQFKETLRAKRIESREVAEDASVSVGQH